MQSYAYLGDENKVLLGKKGDDTIQLYLHGQGIDEHLGHIDANGVKVYALDHHNSVLNGAAAGVNHAYSIWGEILGVSPAVTASSDALMLGWQGLPLDAESGLYDNGPRAYDPVTARHPGPDPIGFAGGTMNLYESRRNNPLRYMDPQV